MCSAAAAGVPAARIMKCGRWTSDAWMAYLVQAPGVSQKAAQAMWAQAHLDAKSPGLGVVEFDVDGYFHDECELSAAERDMIGIKL